MSDLRINCNQGQQKQTLRISSPPLDGRKTPACLGLSQWQQWKKDTNEQFLELLPQDWHLKNAITL